MLKPLCFTAVELYFPKVKIQDGQGPVGSAKKFGFYFALHEEQ